MAAKNRQQQDTMEGRLAVVRRTEAHWLETVERLARRQAELEAVEELEKAGEADTLARALIDGTGDTASNDLAVKAAARATELRALPVALAQARHALEFWKEARERIEKLLETEAQQRALPGLLLAAEAADKALADAVRMLRDVNEQATAIGIDRFYGWGFLRAGGVGDLLKNLNSPLVPDPAWSTYGHGAREQLERRGAELAEKRDSQEFYAAEQLAGTELAFEPSVDVLADDYRSKPKEDVAIAPQVYRGPRIIGERYVEPSDAAAEEVG